MTNEMRVLSVRQPWAWAIVHAQKDVENRTRNIAGDYRGPIAIHVSGKYAENVYSDVLDDAMTDWYDNNADAAHLPWLSGVGKIIGVVDLVDVHRGLAPSRNRSLHVGSCYRAGKRYGACSPWAEPHAVHLELANARPLTEAISFTGALGLRRLDENMQARIVGALPSLAP